MADERSEAQRMLDLIQVDLGRNLTPAFVEAVVGGQPMWREVSIPSGDTTLSVRVTFRAERIGPFPELQMISDALRLRCHRCKGMHLTVADEEPIAGFPIISYMCRECGFDSKKPEPPCEHGRPHGHPCPHCLGINHLDPDVP